MKGFNQITVGGNLTADPSMTRVGENLKATFRIAANDTATWTDKDGNKQERDQTAYIDCEVWGKLAETVEQYCKKGSAVFVTGMYQVSQWDDSRKLVNQETGEEIKLINSRPFIKVEELILAGGGAKADTLLSAIAALSAFSKNPDHAEAFKTMTGPEVLTTFEALYTAREAKRAADKAAAAAAEMAGSL